MRKNDTEITLVTAEGVSLEEIMKNGHISEGLDLNMPIIGDEEANGEEYYGEVEIEDESKAAFEKETDRTKKDWKKRVPMPSMKINCDLEVTLGSKNKIIYVCPGKVQYFTASAISCSGDEVIEIEYCGRQQYNSCKNEGIIRGCLGYYKIVKSGIIFIPRNKLSEFPDDWCPTDILCFKAKSKCDKDVKFDVVFTYSRCVDCECGCGKSCKC